MTPVVGCVAIWPAIVISLEEGVSGMVVMLL